MISFFRDLIDRLLRCPELKNFNSSDFDSVNATAVQRDIFNKKKIMGILYKEYCRPFLESANRAPIGATMVEVGSGVSPLKRYISELICTDLSVFSWLDMVSSAYTMPYKDRSVDRIFLMFVFHHLGKAEAFLSEAYRCLKTGGEIVIIDPAITLFSNFYYRCFHVDKIDVESGDWGFKGDGRITNSNIALLWIVFFRDRERLKRLYPDLIIEQVEYNTFLSFLLSGGLRIRQLLPTSVLKVLFTMENWIIRHISNQIAVTMSVTIRRI